MSKVVALFFSVIFSFGLLLTQNALALEILLSDNGSDSLDVGSRLTGLGHNVTESDAATWGASFDYSIYDVVVFQFNSSNPGDIPHLISAVDTNDVGVVFFRGYGAEATATAMGLITGPNLWYQQPSDLNIIDNAHPITSGLDIGVQNLGYTYMTLVEFPGPDTTVLGTGPDGAALVVHNTRAAVISPFYAHPDNYDLETPNATQITEQSLQWAAGAITNPDSFNVVASVVGGNGTVSCNPANVAPGGSSTCTAVPDQGYQVSGWTGDCAAAGTSTVCDLVDIQADQSSTVSFATIPVVTFDVSATVAGSNGSVSCDPISVPIGGSSTCTAIPDPGYEVSGWTGACEAAGTTTVCDLVDIQANQSSTVSFVAVFVAPTPNLVPVPGLSKSGLALLSMLLLAVAAVRYRW